MPSYQRFSIVACVCVLAFAGRGLCAQTMLVACDPWPPYQYVDKSGHLTGFSVEVAKRVLAVMGYKADIDLLPWKRAIDGVAHGDYHMIISVNMTEDRKSFLNYPKEPLIVTQWAAYTSGQPVLKIEDMDEMAIGVVDGYSYTPEYLAFIETKKGRTEKVVDDESNLKKLVAGRLDAFVADTGNMAFIDPSGQAVRQPFILKRDGLYAAFSRIACAADTAERFSEALAAFKSGKEYRELTKRYFGHGPGAMRQNIP